MKRHGAIRIELEPDDVLFFLHIPKTGGISVLNVLDSHFQPHQIYPPRNRGEGSFTDFTPDQLKQFRLVRGHFRFGPNQDGIYQHLTQHPVCMTFLRDPIARTISTYKHLLRHPETAVTKELQALFKRGGVTLREFVADPASRLELGNRQVRELYRGLEESYPLRGDSPAARLTPLEVAKRQLDQYAFVGITERFRESMELLTYTFGWQPLPNIPKLNASPADQASLALTDEMIDLIHQCTSQDMELYAHGCKVFEQRYQQMIAGQSPAARFVQGFKALTQRLLHSESPAAPDLRKSPASMQPPRDLRVKLRADDVLFYLHIPKVGGSSLTDILDRQFRAEQIYPHRSLAEGSFTDFSPQELKRFRFVRGHYRLDEVHEFFTPNPICITFLREPVARTLSTYKYLLVNPTYATGEKLQALFASGQITLEEFVTDPASLYEIRNRQVVEITSPSRFGYVPREDFGDEPIDIAKQRLSQFQFVGINERFRESVDLMTYTFGWDSVDSIPRINVSPTHQVDASIPGHIIEIIKEHTQLDAELYEFGCQLFEQRYQQMLAEIQAPIAG